MSSPFPIESEFPPCPMEEEISREQAMQNLFTMEEICDLTIKGSDGVLVPVNRGMLAARSLVFRSMLFGNFLEAKSAIVSIGYEGCVIRALVEYIHTDQCKLLTLEEDEGSLNADFVETVISLTEAANYFGLRNLHKMAENCLNSEMKKQPGLAFVALVACEKRPAIADGVEKRARRIIRSSLSEVLDGNGDFLVVATPSLLESILKDDKMETDDYTLFLLLKKWADADGSERLGTAAELTKFLRLNRIDPSELSTSVQHSGLVTVQQLFEAYQKQALLLQARLGVSFKQPRTTRAVWETSNDAVIAGKDVYVEQLNCPVMLSGVHKWTIKAEKIDGQGKMGLGVISTVKPISRKQWLGQAQGGWGFWSSRTLWHNSLREQSPLPFAEGSEVSVEIDLREAGGGKLSASVDGGPFVLLFSDMLGHLQNHIPLVGFIPAVSLFGSGKACLVEMTEVVE